MSDLSDYQRLVVEPLEAQYRALARDHAALLDWAARAARALSDACEGEENGDPLGHAFVPDSRGRDNRCDYCGWGQENWPHAAHALLAEWNSR